MAAFPLIHRNFSFASLLHASPLSLLARAFCPVTSAWSAQFRSGLVTGCLGHGRAEWAGDGIAVESVHGFRFTEGALCQSRVTRAPSREPGPSLTSSSSAPSLPCLDAKLAVTHTGAFLVESKPVQARAALHPHRAEGASWPVFRACAIWGSAQAPEVWRILSLARPWAVLSPRVPTWVSGGKKLGLNLCSRPFEGLPAEGLLHRHPGAPGTHGGGLLEDGLGVEVPRDRDADRSPGERAGQRRPSRPLTHTSRSPPAGPPSLGTAHLPSAVRPGHN